MFSLFKKKYIISFLLCGLDLFVCYMIAGILGERFDAGNPIFQSVRLVLSTPFSNHFNDFTPVLLLMGFVLFEFTWFYKFIRPEIGKGESRAAASTENTRTGVVPNYGVDSATGEENDFVRDQRMTAAKDIDITKFGFVIPEDVEGSFSRRIDEQDMYAELTPEADNMDSQDGVDDEIASFSGDVFWELSGDYAPDQIREMVQLKRYIKNLDAVILRQTFKPSLSAEDIREYIELFYGGTMV